MEAISRSCLPAAAARTKRQRKATCCGVLGAASHRTTCSRSSAAKLTSGLILAMRTSISYWTQYVYLFMIHTTSCSPGQEKTNRQGDAGSHSATPHPSTSSHSQGTRLLDQSTRKQRVDGSLLEAEEWQARRLI